MIVRAFTLVNLIGSNGPRAKAESSIRVRKVFIWDSGNKASLMDKELIFGQTDVNYLESGKKA